MFDSSKIEVQNQKSTIFAYSVSTSFEQFVEMYDGTFNMHLHKISTCYPQGVEFGVIESGVLNCGGF